MIEELLATLRNSIYWGIDWLKGGEVRRHYNDVKCHFQHFDSPQNASARANYLQEVLQHAVETVPFYQNEKGKCFLHEFPVVNKGIIKSDYQAFISNLYDVAKLYKTTTSGSTGTPFTIYKDPKKIKRHTAENIFYSERAGFRVGTRLYYLRVWNEINKKKPLQQFIANIAPVEISNLSDTVIGALIETLAADNVEKSMLGFASAFEAIAQYIQVQKPKKRSYQMRSIVAMSEAFPDAARAIMQEHFNCPVISRYSNMENGFVAQQLSNSDPFYYINHGSFHIEILDLDKDIPAQPGTLGRIVITDLFNYAMPFIRYDTGDLGKMELDGNRPACGPILTHIEGRKVDFIYDTAGNLLSPHTITNTMWRFSEIRQFQFIQKGEKDYEIRINHPGVFGRDIELTNDLRHYLGIDAQILLTFVDEIPPLSSGKRKKIINEYLKP